MGRYTPSSKYLLVCGLLLKQQRAYYVGAQSDDSSAGATPSPTELFLDYPDCTGYRPHINDSYCDEANNVAECGFDGGDCCACTCIDSPVHGCGEVGGSYDCQDPDVPDDCGVTPSPAASFGYPDCTGALYSFQNGYCNYDLNTAACGYDGGDCCRCTCRNYTPDDDDYWYTYCSSFDCQDPSAPNDCEVETDSPTPSPTPGAYSEYPGCYGTVAHIADGDCDSSNNNAACDYDGGDCCVCTCVDGPFFTCGDYYYCLDPSAPDDCEVETDSPTPIQTAGPSAIPTAGTSSDYLGCTGTISYISDGDCNYSTNNAACGYDGGDCCACTCVDASFTCGDRGGYSCLDPAAACTSTTSAYGDDSYQSDYTRTYFASSASSVNDDDACTGRASSGTGLCNPEYNTPECDYDGGDCCECTCVDDNYTCGLSGYDCRDPSADCPTPSPTEDDSSRYSDCDWRTYAGNGLCDSQSNTPECGYDGGDCCECTCITSEYECGASGGYDCLDPFSYCASSSLTSDQAGSQRDAESFANSDSDMTFSSLRSSFTGAEFAAAIVLSVWVFVCLGSLIYAVLWWVRRRLIGGAPTDQVKATQRLAKPAVTPEPANVASIAAASAAEEGKSVEVVYSGKSEAPGAVREKTSSPDQANNETLVYGDESTRVRAGVDRSKGNAESSDDAGVEPRGIRPVDSGRAVDAEKDGDPKDRVDEGEEEESDVGSSNGGDHNNNNDSCEIEASSRAEASEIPVTDKGTGVVPPANKTQ